MGKWKIDISDPQVNWIEGAINSGIVAKLPSDIFEVDDQNIDRFLSFLDSNHRQSYDLTSNSQYSQLLRDFDNDITGLEESQQRNNDHRIFTQKYLNVHERLAYLAVNDLIPSNVATYFSDTRKSIGITPNARI
jgi:hypothetical protein